MSPQITLMTADSAANRREKTRIRMLNHKGHEVRKGQPELNTED
jgi:hypothetical protein